MSAPAIVLLAVPFFALLLGLELWQDSRNGWKHYKSLRDTLSNLYIGAGEVILSLVLKGSMIVLYDLVLKHFALFKIPDSWWSGIVFFLLFDFIYYWAHRLGHEINLMWAGHVPHHSSEAFNLTVALRQPWFQVLTTWFLFVPLAVLGFSTRMLIVVSALDILYQFWIHTPYIRKLPAWFEFVFNTPSHHRVHHGRQEKYLDKNHGGVLIIWDRLFGTFQEEEETPDYGITQPLHSFNPLWANVHHFAAITRATLHKNPKSWGGMMFSSPRRFATFAPAAPGSASTSAQKRIPLKAAVFLIWHFLHGIVQTLWLLSMAPELTTVVMVVCIVLILWHIVNAGMMLDGRLNAEKAEILRLTSLMIIVLLLIIWPIQQGDAFLLPAIYLVIYAGVSAVWMWVMKPLRALVDKAP